MVFPGKLSTSCHVCRRRKVKCDGARPGCSRCARHGVKCSGYPEKFSFREYKPQQKHETPACALSQRPDNSVLRARSRSSGSLQEPPFATSKIPSKGLSECPDWQSLCNFMNRIVIQVHRSPCSGHLAFMPDLFREKGAAPHLKHAILSVSHLTIFNDTGHREFYWRARKNHGLALGHLNKALGSHENAVKDETLAACLLMSMFYNFVHEGEGLPDPHMAGICNLLQLRGNEQLKSMYTRPLMAWVIIQVQSQAFGTNKFKYVKLPQLIEDIPKPDCVLGAGILNCRISHFCQLVSDMHDPSAYSSNERNSRQEETLRKTLTLARYMIDEIDIWNASIPSHWKIQYQFESFDRAAASTDSPRDPWTLTFLASTQSAQLVFYAHVISCCEQSREQGKEFNMPNFSADLVAFERGVTDRAAHLLKTICYTISTAIGFLDTDGNFHPVPGLRFANNNSLIWPIWAALTCPLACDDQTELCRRSLEFIGQNTGHKLALFLSEKASAHI